MSPLEIVLLAMIGGMLILFLAAACIYVSWMLHTSRRFLSALIAALQSSTQDISLLRGQIEAILKSHHQEMQQVVSRINGDKLVEASDVILKAAHRIETAAVAFGNLAKAILTQDEVREEIEEAASRAIDAENSGETSLRRARRTGLGPESYAPNPTQEKWTGQSRTAAQDSRELLDGGEEDGENQD